MTYPIKMTCTTDENTFVLEQDAKKGTLTMRYLQSKTKQGLVTITNHEHVEKMLAYGVFEVIKL